MNARAHFAGAVLSGLTLVLSGCGSAPPVSVDDRSGNTRQIESSMKGAALAAPASNDGPSYTVKKGDTLLAIALDQGKDYRDLAQWNNLDNPNLVRVGQVLRLTPPGQATVTPVAESAVVIKPITAPAPLQAKPVPVESAAVIASAPVATGSASGMNTQKLKREPKGGTQPYSETALAQLREKDAAYDKARQGVIAKSPTVEPVVPPAPAVVPSLPPVVAVAPATSSSAAPAVTGVSWSWPVPGKLIAPFSEGSNKGIDLAGKLGEPVLAAAAGRVSYVGSSLRGYGKMVVIKHAGDFLSVYAHNNQVLVNEGQSVVAGQKIAELGSSDTDTPKLHFEIRRQGKPVDPAGILPAR